MGVDLGGTRSRLTRRLGSLSPWWELWFKLERMGWVTVTHGLQARDETRTKWVITGATWRYCGGREGWDGSNSLSGSTASASPIKLSTASLRVPLPANASGLVRMQSLFRSVGRPAGFCPRRSLFSACFPVYSARTGSNSRASGKRPTPPESLNLLSANPRRACSSTARMSSPVTHPEYRLPPNVKPSHYDLTIRTNLENQTFDGSVDVQCVANLI